MSRTKGALGKKTLAKMGLLTNSLDKYKIDHHQNDGKNTQNHPQNNDKPKRVRRTRKQLIADGYYDNRQKCDKKVQINTQNVDKPKRIRRTKKQLIADGYYDNKDKKSNSISVNSISAKQKNADNGNVFKSHSMTVEEVSERQIQKAKERGDENWESDFRNDYEYGQRIYYVEINPLCHTKEVLELYVGTVYAKTMIAWVEKGEAHPISMEDADKIFREEKEAKKYYSKVRI